MDNIEDKLDHLTRGIQALDETDQTYMDTLTASLVRHPSPNIPDDPSQVKTIIGYEKQPE
jgi:hypothetical protein